MKSPNEIIESPDFQNILKFLYKKMGLSRYADYEEIVQRVALQILKYGVSKECALSTSLTQCCKWAVSKRKRVEPPNLFRFTREGFADSGFRKIDEKDEEDFLISMLTKKQKRIIMARLAGKTQVEISKEIGTSRQNVQCVQAYACKRVLEYKREN